VLPDRLTYLPPPRTCSSIAAALPADHTRRADAHHELVTGDKVRIAFEVARYRVVELVSLSLGPLDEATFVGEPPGGAHEAGIAIRESVVLVDQPVDIGLLATVRRPGLAVVAFRRRTHQHPAPEGSSERHA
jgi:hypothetical protein